MKLENKQEINIFPPPKKTQMGMMAGEQVIEVARDKLNDPINVIIKDPQST